jgi:hypothetical protein
MFGKKREARELLRAYKVLEASLKTVDGMIRQGQDKKTTKVNGMTMADIKKQMDRINSYERTL